MNNIKSFIIDWIFPVECIICGKPEYWICEDCLSLVEFKPVNSCPFCHCFSLFGLTCKKCKKEKFLRGIFCYNSYRNSILKKIIHVYKYNFLKKLSENLAEMMRVSLENIKSGQALGVLPKIISEDTFYFFVPLHKIRLRERGFNQSALLLEELINKRVISSDKPGSGLIRKRYTIPQAKIKNEKERINNLGQAFDYSGKSLKNKTVILIDDVSTTGTTLNECARVLKESGAKNIYGLVIVRG